ncbi:MAG: TetR/AcrR family transcriptional regulator [Thermodesulfobacteriota bacterium]|nr:TetR/AcrR family transcriptional regulator [Thermodesulfobacteriota bacterium]
MNVTIQLILNKGVESFSMRDLSKESGLSVGLIYHYFSDKQEIIQTALQTHIHDCTKQIVSEINTIKDTKKKLQKKITDISSIYKEYPTLFKILINFISWSMYNNNAQVLLSDMFIEMRSYLSSLIEATFSPENLERKEIENLAYLILGSAIGISIQKCVDNNKINTSKDISKQLSKMIFHYLDDLGS